MTTIQTIVNAASQFFIGWQPMPGEPPAPMWSPVRDGGLDRAVIYPNGWAELEAVTIRRAEPCTVQTWELKL